jgi:ligand-binding sensor domain-containing protein
VRRPLSLALAAAIACAGSGCRGKAPVPRGQAAAYEAARPPPAAGGGELEEITAIAAGRGVVFIGTTAGPIRLDPDSGAHELVRGDDAVSHAGVVDLALDADGTAWTAHAAGPGSGHAAPGASRAPRRGGVRALHEGGREYSAWFAEDGLGATDVAAIAVGDGRVVAAVGPGLARLDQADATQLFRPLFTDSTLRLTVVDLADVGAEPRSVQEFRPRSEVVRAVAVAGEDTWVGTTHGLYRLRETGVERFVIPCGTPQGRASLVTAAWASAAGGVIATLGVPRADGGFEPAGMLEHAPGSPPTCHEPGVDVPDSPALDVDRAEGTTWLGTYEGLVRVRGRDVELLDADAGAPPGPVTAVAAEGADACWVGTWGHGAWRLQGDRWTLYRFVRPDGVAARAEGRLRP